MFYMYTITGLGDQVKPAIYILLEYGLRSQSCCSTLLSLFDRQIIYLGGYIYA